MAMIQLQLFIVVLLVVYVKYVNSTDVQVDRIALVWKPNDAGLYSHFFQTKYMSGIATKYKRTLSIAPYSDSAHAKDKGSIILCDIFDFEDTNVSCLRNSTTTKLCNKYFDFLISPTSVRTKSTCFDGRVFGKSGIVPNATRLATMNVGPRLKFVKKYVSWFESIRNSYLASQASSKRYIVVHWRRGDQLTTRCTDSWKGVRDYSVNCGSVSGLAASINTFLDKASMIIAESVSADHKAAYSSIDYRKLPILIATNEKNGTILNELRSLHYTPLAEMIIKHDTQHQLNGSMDEFLVESQFMLDASVLLTFGVSGINDVLESERLQRGLPFCSASISDPPGVYHNNWCTLYLAATPAERNQPLPRPLRAADESTPSVVLQHRRSSGGGSGGGIAGKKGSVASAAVVSAARKRTSGTSSGTNSVSTVAKSV